MLGRRGDERQGVAGQDMPNDAGRRCGRQPEIRVALTTSSCVIARFALEAMRQSVKRVVRATPNWQIDMSGPRQRRPSLHSR